MSSGVIIKSWGTLKEKLDPKTVENILLQGRQGDKDWLRDAMTEVNLRIKRGSIYYMTHFHGRLDGSPRKDKNFWTQGYELDVEKIFEEYSQEVDDLGPIHRLDPNN